MAPTLYIGDYSFLSCDGVGWCDVKTGFNGAGPPQRLTTEPAAEISPAREVGERGFRNPTPKDPVEVSDFLSHCDLTPVKQELLSHYRESWRSRLPPEAMLKTAVCYVLSGIRFLKGFFRKLDSNPVMAANLGFKVDEHGKPKTPSYPALWHFINARLGDEGVRELVDAAIKEINVLAARKGVKLGEEGVGVDACPLEGVKSDEDATYNGHYKIKGYFWHNVRCLKHNLPLTYHVTSATEDDGRLLSPLLYKIRWLGVEFNDVYVDGKYASLANIGRLRVLFGVSVHCNIAKDWVYRRDGILRNLWNRYQRLPENFHVDDVSLDDMLSSLFMADQVKPVGAYYRNSILARYEEHPEGFLDDYHLRNRVEGSQGVEKRSNGVGQIEARGIGRVSTHVGLHVLAVQVVALTRLQNNVTENLGSMVGLI